MVAQLGSLAPAIASAPLRMMGGQGSPSASQGSWFERNGLGSFADATANIRNITRPLAAALSDDPRLAQAAAQSQQQADQERQARQRQIMEYTFANLAKLEEVIAANPAAYQQPAFNQYVERSLNNLRAIGLPEEQIQQSSDYLKALAGLPVAAKEAQFQQFYNPQTKESRAVNINDPKDVAAAQATGFTTLGSPQSSDVKSPEAMAQAKELASLSAARNNTTIVNAGPKVLMASDEELMKSGDQSAMQGRAILPLLDLAESAAKNYKATGPGGQFVLDMKRFGAMLGLKSDATAGEVLASVQQQLAGLQRLPGSGSQSDREFATYMASVPGLLQSQQGNITLARIGRKLINRRIEEFERLKKHVFESGSSVGFEYNMDPVLTEEEFNQLAGAALGGQSTGGAPPADPPPGWEFVQ